TDFHSASFVFQTDSAVMRRLKSRPGAATIGPGSDDVIDYPGVCDIQLCIQYIIQDETIFVKSAV
ncbi:MAG: hypothetical protein LWX00_09065, partial [Spirochaetia bacterium]|nr:hypothetical protein [Spirochaetia bacterium]